MSSNDEIFNNIEDVLQRDEGQSTLDSVISDSIIMNPQKPYTHFMSIGTDYPDDAVLLRTLERFLKMCPMIKQPTLPEVFNADEIKGQSVSQTIESNRLFVFPGDFKEENMPKTVAFAFVAQFASPSQVMKFLMGLVGVIRKNSDVCSMFAYSAYDRYGLPADNWRNGLCSVLTSSDLKNLADHNFTLDEKNIFSNVYEMFNVLYPKESVYDYLQELSGGYIATNMLYDKIS